MLLGGDERDGGQLGGTGKVGSVSVFADVEQLTD